MSKALRLLSSSIGIKPPLEGQNPEKDVIVLEGGLVYYVTAKIQSFIEIKLTVFFSFPFSGGGHVGSGNYANDERKKAYE